MLALARRQLSQSHERVSTEGIDIRLILDIAESMHAEEINQLERTKIAVLRYVRHKGLAGYPILTAMILLVIELL